MAFDNFKYKTFLVEGKEKEELFCLDICAERGGKAYLSTDTVDIFEHIDVFWEYQDGKTVSFDVKGLKKTNRHDSNVNPDIEWVEIQNVNGGKGWLYGNATYISFESVEDWIVIDRKRLLSLLRDNINDFSISNKKNGMYRLYQRTGRKDIIVQVPTVDIRNVANIIIPKRKIS